MFFIVKVRMWEGPVLLTMKNIVKAAGPPQLRVLSSPAPAPTRKSPLTKKKNLAGSPFELGLSLL
ncbi:hypothetical protein J2Z66_000417 [Paenibacillus eucommiae]|uniref:Uncharacterized protein n=1 Tax=Paenibacillus eucommiae TaxID=1355755 RepID=A0ABS4IML9_9BACL|nr:hypothetical protein [Paenibacillus eucommiae]